MSTLIEHLQNGEIVAYYGYQDELVEVIDELERQAKEIEKYQLQLASISTAVLGYWTEGDSIHPDYDTPTLHDVARLYAKYDSALKAALAVPETKHVALTSDELNDLHRRLGGVPRFPTFNSSKEHK